MRRAVAVLCVWLLADATASGQDMDLSQVLMEGEGWRPSTKDAGERLKLGKRPARAVSPDGGTLVAVDPGGRHLTASRLGPDGETSATERYYPLHLRRQNALAVGGMTFDRDRRLYVATATGVQVFDPTGRLCGELLPPERGKKVKDVAFGGKGRDKLFVLSESGKVFSRKVKSKGVAPAKEK